MKLLPAGCALTLLACSSVALAQQPKQPLVTKIDRPPVATLQVAPPATPQYAPQTLSTPPVTPELWVYSQEQLRHDDPAQAVRRKAEFQASQRMSRLASLKWYGYSNSRPEAGMTPIMGTYSAGWIGNAGNRYDWGAFGYPATVWLW